MNWAKWRKRSLIPNLNWYRIHFRIDFGSASNRPRFLTPQAFQTSHRPPCGLTLSWIDLEAASWTWATHGPDLNFANSLALYLCFRQLQNRSHFDSGQNAIKTAPRPHPPHAIFNFSSIFSCENWPLCTDFSNCYCLVLSYSHNCLAHGAQIDCYKLQMASLNWSNWGKLHPCMALLHRGNEILSPLTVLKVFF